MSPETWNGGTAAASAPPEGQTRSARLTPSATTARTKTPEQEARDLLERMGVDGAQEMSSGDVVELANLVAKAQTPPRGVEWHAGYDVGYRDGENNRVADAQIFHEEALNHDSDCRCPLGAFLANVGAY